MAAKSDKLRSASDFRLETLEPRILFAADAAIAGLDLAALAGAPVAVMDTWNSEAANTERNGPLNEARQVKELVIIDSAVADIDALVADIEEQGTPASRITVRDTRGDALTSITDLLLTQNGLNAVHIISHGANGELTLGGERIDALGLLTRADDLAGWRDAFAEGADILLYGCEVATDGAGRQFVDTLARLTGADVSASNDLTGATVLGGDWELEYRIGEVDRETLVSKPMRDDYLATLSTYNVTNFANDGSGSLREAITQLNSTGIIDTIQFDRAGTIELTSELPTITNPVVIDATVGTGYSDTPLVILDGALHTDSPMNGLVLGSGSDNSIVRGLMIINFTADGLVLYASDDHIIESNYIGTDGVSAMGNDIGIYAEEATGITIGGAGGAGRNVISDNTFTGIYFSSGAGQSMIQSNRIGTDSAGTSSITSSVAGVYVDSGASLVQIGGSGTTSGNLISGNGTHGVAMVGAGMSNHVTGNLIWTMVDGTTPLGNQGTGVHLENTAQSLIGTGVQIYSTASANRVGGTEAEGNVVSANDSNGIEISGNDTDDNVVAGNLIGLEADGKTAVGNTSVGVFLHTDAGGTLIGIGRAHWWRQRGKATQSPPMSRTVFGSAALPRPVRSSLATESVSRWTAPQAALGMASRTLVMRAPEYGSRTVPTQRRWAAAAQARATSSPATPST